MPMSRCIDGPLLKAIRLGACHVFALLIVWAGAGTIGAQEYKVDAVDADAAKFAGIARNQLVRDASRYATEKARFADYFTKAYFPQMTRTEPADLAKIGDARYKLFKDYLWGTTNEQLQSDLTSLTFGAMGRIVAAQNPPYHPAVRYNAVLILGMLDEQYPREGANPRPSKPLVRATKALTQLVNTATTSSRFSPAVILGAVIGLERHSQYRDSIAPADAQAMTAALLKLVNHEEPIQEMDRSAYAWLRVRAAGVLAQLGSPGSNNSVHEAILKLIANLRSLDDRCGTAALLKKLDYKDAKVDPATTTDPLFQLACDLGEAEAKRAQDFQEKRIGGGGFVPSARGEGGYGGPSVFGEQQEEFPRRHVLARLLDLRAGLQAAKPLVPAETQAKVDAVMAAIKPVIDAAVDKNTVELKFTAAINTMASAINRAVPPPEPAAAEAAAEADAF